MLNIKPEEDKELKKLLTELGRESKSKIVFLIDKSGQLISRSDSPAFSSDDITFASLTAGNVAASEALSKLLGDKNLNHMFTETQDEGIYMALLEGKYILVSIFDKGISNLGIVRVKMKKFHPKLSAVVKKIEEREKRESKVSTDINLEEIDLDSLFN
ncbi:Roadblock/LC7 family protein [Desulfurobacterium thermolithotrophum DSM 11699]|uniref:Roadblock/LC7 family protein n=1 Tax=Desulfurobacterium thermolithotrophum (strain DSM 11699 / BSA) TaxID=868864 RepID=F0S025_DESTD|nr:roadblock/LC7 domain-containing protein [Desulfurobacterium thermolithotrophum]ADY73706.1 Roadblock/LC7 family protein [Desulfurobacterium thermolithotrophum DSM 11699]